MEDGILVVITSAPERPDARAHMQERFKPNEVAEISVTDLDLTAIASRCFRDDIIDEAIMKNFYRNPEQSAKQVFTMPRVSTGWPASSAARSRGSISTCAASCSC